METQGGCNLRSLGSPPASRIIIFAAAMGADALAAGTCSVSPLGAHLSSLPQRATLVIVAAASFGAAPRAGFGFVTRSPPQPQTQEQYWHFRDMWYHWSRLSL